ncbi:hypothetical protein ABZ642_29080 [Streptomyces sp. NPDC007157]|uniref:hypothetical protein n=1 Tax=Streptomyces sp. NPDC007157 TaxID=3154681 RepID=UPI0033FB382B
MKDEEILAHFDGRGTAEITLLGLDVLQNNKIAAVAYEMGYRLHSRDIVTQGQWHLVYLRDDSPDVRRRTQDTLNRLRSGGPLLPMVWPPATTPNGAVRPVTAEQAASARQGMAAYESHGSRGLVVIAALFGIGSLLLAWVARQVPAASVALLLGAVAMAVVAVLVPRWMKSWYERSRRLVDGFEQQRSRRWGSPPPPPPSAPGAGPADPAGNRS